MSFRLYIYYCALCGAGAALLGWVLGRAVAGSGGLLAQGLKGLFLGLFVSVALAVVDSTWNASLRQVESIVARTLTALLIGSLGGFIGGVIGQALVNLTGEDYLLIVGWTLTGLLVGAAPGGFDLIVGQMGQQDASGAQRKVINGVIGGAIGGLLGGLLSLVLHTLWSSLFESKPYERLLSPSATGFVALGACIGLLIGLAQVILKEAWLRVEKGFRAGRELMLTKPVITVGRAESCDVGLFGDNAVERMHAQLEKQGDAYVLTDSGSATGTYVNEQRIDGPRRLRAGDVIRVGRTVLSFGERRKQGETG